MNRSATPSVRAAPQSRDARYVWKFPGSPVRIRIGLDAVRRIREYAAGDTGRMPISEAGGLLLGRPRATGVEIDDFVPVPRDEGFGPHFVFSDDRKAALGSCIEAANRQAGELSVVGYFRCDLREGIRLYENDVALIREFFADRSNVFLVIRPREAAHPTAGFFFWEGDRIFSACSFMEFDFEESMLASASYAAGDGNGRQRPGSMPAPPENEAAANPRHWRRWLAVGGIAVAVALVLGAYPFVRRWTALRPTVSPPVVGRTVRQDASMGLAVGRSGTDIHIAWNGAAPLVTEARVGMLSIEDGNVRRDLPLTAVQLRSSRLVYTPRSDTVQVALEIFAHDGKVTRESVIAMSNSGAQTAAASDARPYPVEVPVDRRRKTVRDFVTPVPRTEPEAPLAGAAVEPPPAGALRVDAVRMDLPVAALPAPVAPVPEPIAAPAQPLPAVAEPARQPPVPLRQVRPDLPSNVKAMVTGRVTVQVRVQVDATGKVSSAEPLAAAGSLGRFLGSAAAGAARRWTFEPATAGGERVPGELTLAFVFLPER